jgi:uncharacterized protein (TIGR02246 family)
VPTPTDTYEQLSRAWSQADAETAAALYSPDAVWFDADNRAHRGRDGILDHLKGRFATAGPVTYTIKRQVAGGQVVLTEWTRAAEEDGRRSTGLPGATVLELGPDGIVYHRDYQ